uniref:Uncharacterized protein n=1 Tax=Panagrolaimus sp. ES5 TaxID=591445 RepID=A0AC34GFY6_9BILA
MSMKSQLEHRASYSSVSKYEKAFLYEQYLEIIRWETFYNICHLLFVFWLPATVIAVSYISVLCILKSFSRQPADVFDEMTTRTSLFSMIFSTTKHTGVKLTEQNSNSSTYNEIEPEDVTSQSLPGIILKQNSVIPKRSCEDLKKMGSSLPERRSLMFFTPVQRYYQRSQSEQLKPIILNKNSVSSQAQSSRSNSKIGPLAMQTIALARQ